MAPSSRALGKTIGAEQHLGLGGLEPVALHRRGHSLLLLGTEAAQRVGKRHAEPSLVDLALQRLA